MSEDPKDIARGLGPTAGQVAMEIFQILKNESERGSIVLNDPAYPARFAELHAPYAMQGDSFFIATGSGDIYQVSVTKTE